MKTKKILTILVLGLIVCMAMVTIAAPMGTTFTFQGRLMDKNKPADGSYDFKFKLYDSNDPCTGTQLGTNDINDVDVIDGHFVVELDFGSDVFNGNAVWLETKIVRSPTGSDPAALRPLMEITPTPYALQTRGIFVDPNGNVGIGTKNPQGLLQVGEGTFVVNRRDNLVGIEDGDPDARLEISPGDPAVDLLMLSSVPEADGDLVIVRPNGSIGIGTTNPTARLEVEQSEENTTALLIEKTGTGWGPGITVDNDGTGYGIYIKQDGQREGLFIEQNANAIAQTIQNVGTWSGLLIHQGGELVSGESALVVGSDTPQTISPLVNIIQDNPSSTFAPLWIHNDGSGHDIDEKEHGAYLHNGQWVNGCSIVNKEHLEDVDGTEILSRVEDLRIKKFNMKGSTDKHISATAEDFYAAFGLGDDKGISAGDVASIALICIKELKKENEALKERIQALEKTVQKRLFDQVKEAQK